VVQPPGLKLRDLTEHLDDPGNRCRCQRRPALTSRVAEPELDGLAHLREQHPGLGHEAGQDVLSDLVDEPQERGVQRLVLRAVRLPEQERVEV